MSREETCSVMSVVRTVTAEGDSSSRTRKWENRAREERGGGADRPAHVHAQESCKGAVMREIYNCIFRPGSDKSIKKKSVTKASSRPLPV